MIFDIQSNKAIPFICLMTIASIGILLMPNTSRGQSDPKTPSVKSNTASEQPKPPPRLIHPGMVVKPAVMLELGLEKDSPVTAEIRKMNQDIVNEIQAGLRDAAKAGNLKSGATRDVFANVGAKYVLAMKQLLTPEQFSRLQQIHWQQAGTDAVYDPDLAKALELTPEQFEKFATIDEEVEKQRKEFSGQLKTLVSERKALVDKSENLDEVTTRIQSLKQKTQNLDPERSLKYQNILTTEQQTKLVELKGKPFDLPKRVAPESGRPFMPISARPGGLMALALKDPVLKELGLNNDAGPIAEIRKLSEAHAEELREQLQTESARDQEKVQEIEGRLHAKYDVPLKTLLTPDQFERLRQIYWQQLRAGVLYEVEIVKTLGITKEQKEQIFAANYELFQTGRKLNNPSGVPPADDEVNKKLTEAASERDKKIDQILTEAQKQKLAELKGKPFDLSRFR